MKWVWKVSERLGLEREMCMEVTVSAVRVARILKGSGPEGKRED